MNFLIYSLDTVTCSFSALRVIANCGGIGIEKDGLNGFDEKQLKHVGLGRCSLLEVWVRLLN